MRQKLNRWLKQSGAKFPARDPRFSQTQFDKKIEKSKTELMRKLERRHAQFHKPDFTPASQSPWWGSAD